MMIPVGAPHAYTAEVYMNFVYDPNVQAQISDYVNYVPPVKGVQQVLQKMDPPLAKSPLMFPDASTLQRAHAFKQLTPEEDDQLNNAFQRVIGA
jgi:spermidine/putrescine transport system substrate-binding protein